MPGYPRGMKIDAIKKLAKDLPRISDYGDHLPLPEPVRMERFEDTFKFYFEPDGDPGYSVLANMAASVSILPNGGVTLEISPSGVETNRVVVGVLGDYGSLVFDTILSNEEGIVVFPPRYPDESAWGLVLLAVELATEIGNVRIDK